MLILLVTPRMSATHQISSRSLPLRSCRLLKVGPLRLCTSLLVMRRRRLALARSNVRRRGGGHIVRGHQVRAQSTSIGVDGLKVWLPLLQLLLSIVEYLSRFARMGEWLAHVAGNDRGIVEKVQQTTAVAGEDDLFLSAFDGRGEVQVVCLLQLLARLRRSGVASSQTG